MIIREVQSFIDNEEIDKKIYKEKELGISSNTIHEFESLISNCQNDSAYNEKSMSISIQNLLDEFEEEEK